MSIQCCHYHIPHLETEDFISAPTKQLLGAISENFLDQSPTLIYTSSILTTSAPEIAGTVRQHKVSVVLVSITEPNYNFKRGHARLKINISLGNNTSRTIYIGPFGAKTVVVFRMQTLIGP